MNVLVRFRTAAGTYAVPIEQTLEVRLATGVVPLPSPSTGVAGVIERDGTTLPVVSVLGGGSRHVVVVTDGGEPAGLLADEVLGVARVPDASMGPPPPGQEEPLVHAVVREDGGMTFVVDVPELLRHVRERTLGELADGVAPADAGEVPGTAAIDAGAAPATSVATTTGADS